MESRSKTFPEVPTLMELGYHFVDPAVYNLAGPKGLPPAVIKKLDEALHKAMSDPEFVQIMEKAEMTIAYRNSAELTKVVEQLYVSIGKMIVDFKLPKQE
jgi:tripartite-type tricarboxylate transporter receptor subunit TctC